MRLYCVVRLRSDDSIRSRTTARRLLLSALAAELPGLITKEVEGFIIILRHCLTSTLAILSSFCRDEGILLLVSPLTTPKYLIIFRVVLFCASRWIVPSLSVSCTIFPCYVTAWASRLLARERDAWAHLAVFSFAFLFIFLGGAPSSLPRASSPSRTFSLMSSM